MPWITGNEERNDNATSRIDYSNIGKGSPTKGPRRPLNRHQTKQYHHLLLILQEQNDALDLHLVDAKELKVHDWLVVALLFGPVQQLDTLVDPESETEPE